jgi:hypothetical protein
MPWKNCLNELAMTPRILQLRRIKAFALAALILPCLAVAQALPSPVPAEAQAAESGFETALLPVVDPRSGRVEHMLLLESPTPVGSGSPVDRVLGLHDRGVTANAPLISWGRPLRRGVQLSSSLSLESQSSLALLCDHGAVLPTLGSLAQHCLLARLDTESDPLLAQNRGASVAGRISLSGGLGSIDLSLAGARLFPNADGHLDFGLPNYFAGQIFGRDSMGLSGLLASEALFLAPGARDARTDFQRLGLTGVMHLGSNGWISLGGTLARAQIIPTAAMLPGPLSWNISELSLGGGYGAFSGAITNRVIEIPGQGGQVSDLDIGFTWRTPWSGQLSIGARNISGDAASTNAFGLPELDVRGESNEATIPYVRYRQDL